MKSRQVKLLAYELKNQSGMVIFGVLYNLFFWILFGLESDDPSASAVYVFGVVGGTLIITFGSFKDTRKEILYGLLPFSRGDIVATKFLLLWAAAGLSFLGTFAGALLVRGVLFVAPSVFPGWASHRLLPTGVDLARIVMGVLWLSIFVSGYLRFGMTAMKYTLIIGLGALLALQVAGFISFGRDADREPLMIRLLEWYLAQPRGARNGVIGGSGLVASVTGLFLAHSAYRRKELP